MFERIMKSTSMHCMRARVHICQEQIRASEVKSMLRRSRETFYSDLGSDIKQNPKRFWSVFKRSSKIGNIPDIISSGNKKDM